MCKPKKGTKSQKAAAREIFETNKSLTRSKATDLAVEITGLTRNYVIHIYGEWEGKKKNIEKPRNMKVMDLFEDNKTLSREELLNKAVEEVEVSKRYAVDLYNLWHDDTPIKKKNEDAYVFKYKGRTREKFMFDDSHL